MDTYYRYTTPRQCLCPQHGYILPLYDTPTVYGSPAWIRTTGILHPDVSVHKNEHKYTKRENASNQYEAHRFALPSQNQAPKDLLRRAS